VDIFLGVGQVERKITVILRRKMGASERRNCEGEGPLSETWVRSMKRKNLERTGNRGVLLIGEELLVYPPLKILLE